MRPGSGLSGGGGIGLDVALPFGFDDAADLFSGESDGPADGGLRLHTLVEDFEDQCVPFGAVAVGSSVGCTGLLGCTAEPLKIVHGRILPLVRMRGHRYIHVATVTYTWHNAIKQVTTPQRPPEPTGAPEPDEPNEGMDPGTRA